MRDEQLKIEKHGKTTVILMRRPAKHNALSPSLLIDLRMAVLEASPLVSLVIASTSDIFSSGLDLDHLEVLKGDKTGLEQYFEMLHALYIAVYAHPAPTFAVIRKGAFGGGFGLACCCDLILANKDCRFILPGDRFGNLARLARPPLMTKFPSIELEAVSPIELTGESAHASGFCYELPLLPPYSNLGSYLNLAESERDKRLQRFSQENFAQMCKRIKGLVLEELNLNLSFKKSI